jgi:hypothetical protein
MGSVLKSLSFRMSLTKHSLDKLVIIAEARLEEDLIRITRQEGASGYTDCDVRGGGSSGQHDGEWDSDRTVRMEIICLPSVADCIAKSVLDQFSESFGVVIYFSLAQVVRLRKYE